MDNQLIAEIVEDTGRDKRRISQVKGHARGKLCGYRQRLRCSSSCGEAGRRISEYIPCIIIIGGMAAHEVCQVNEDVCIILMQQLEVHNVN